MISLVAMCSSWIDVMKCKDVGIHHPRLVTSVAEGQPCSTLFAILPNTVMEEEVCRGPFYRPPLYTLCPSSRLTHQLPSRTCNGVSNNTSAPLQMPIFDYGSDFGLHDTHGILSNRRLLSVIRLVTRICYDMRYLHLSHNTTTRLHRLSFQG